MVDAQESGMLFGDVEEEKYRDFDHDSQFQTDNAMTSKSRNYYFYIQFFSLVNRLECDPTSISTRLLAGNSKK